MSKKQPSEEPNEGTPSFEELKAEHTDLDLDCIVNLVKAAPSKQRPSQAREAEKRFAIVEYCRELRPDLPIKEIAALILKGQREPGTLKPSFVRETASVAAQRDPTRKRRSGQREAMREKKAYKGQRPSREVDPRETLAKLVEQYPVGGIGKTYRYGKPLMNFFKAAEHKEPLDKIILLARLAMQDDAAQAGLPLLHPDSRAVLDAAVAAGRFVS